MKVLDSVAEKVNGMIIFSINEKNNGAPSGKAIQVIGSQMIMLLKSLTVYSYSKWKKRFRTPRNKIGATKLCLTTEQV